MCAYKAIFKKTKPPKNPIAPGIRKRMEIQAKGQKPLFKFVYEEPVDLGDLKEIWQLLVLLDELSITKRKAALAKVQKVLQTYLRS